MNKWEVRKSGKLTKSIFFERLNDDRNAGFGSFLNCLEVVLGKDIENSRCHIDIVLLEVPFRLLQFYVESGHVSFTNLTFVVFLHHLHELDSFLEGRNWEQTIQRGASIGKSLLSLHLFDFC